jgi:hypothetical protein
MRIVLMTVPAIVTGVIRCFANSCLVLRDVVMSRTCSNSNHFGSFRSTMSGGYMFTKIVFPFAYDLTVNYQSFLNFIQYSNVLLLSEDNLLRNMLQTRISNSFSCNILEGASRIPGKHTPASLRGDTSTVSLITAKNSTAMEKKIISMVWRDAGDP